MSRSESSSLESRHDRGPSRGDGLLAFVCLALIITAAGLFTLLLVLGCFVGTAVVSGNHASRSLAQAVFAVTSGYAFVLAALGVVAAAVTAVMKPHLGRRPRLGVAARVSALFMTIVFALMLLSPRLADAVRTDMRFVTGFVAAFAGVAVITLAIEFLPPRGKSATFDRVRFPATLCCVLALTAFAAWPDPVPEPAAVDVPPIPLDESTNDVVILGIDGADWIVLRELMDAGVLPNLSRVATEGVSADLFIRFPFTPPSWATLFSGVEHTEHGIVDFSGHVDDRGDLIRRRRVDDIMSRVFSQPFIDSADSPLERILVSPIRFARQRYNDWIYPVAEELSLLNATHIRHKRLWQIAEDFGLRSGQFGVDMSWPAEPVSGYHISDRFLRGQREAAVYPPRLSDELDEMLLEPNRFPAELAEMFEPVHDSATSGDDAGATGDPTATFYLEETDKQWRHWMNEIRVARRVWTDSDDLDLVILKFRQPDTLKHYLLPFLRPDMFPWIDIPPGSRDAITGLIHAGYRELDRFVGEILASGRVLCVISDHGFYPNPGGEVRTDGVSLDVDALLQELGWLVRGESGAVDADASRASDPGIPTAAGTSIMRAADPGLRPALIADLSAVRDADTGGPVFTSVKAITDLDVQVRYGKAATLRDALEPLTQRIDVGDRVIPMTAVFKLHPTFGGHRRGGKMAGYAQAVFMLHGTPVRSGIRLTDAEDIDITPTVLRLLGVPISDELPGRVIEEALHSEFLEASAPASVASYGPHEFDPDLQAIARHGGGGEEIKKEIVERLRALGYLN